MMLIWSFRFSTSFSSLYMISDLNIAVVNTVRSISGKRELHFIMLKMLYLLCVSSINILLSRATVTHFPNSASVSTDILYQKPHKP